MVMIHGLPFLPGDNIHEGMMQLKDNVQAEVGPVLDFFDVT